MCPQTLEERRGLFVKFKKDYPSAGRAIECLEKSIVYWEQVAKQQEVKKSEGRDS
jgi:hypothetical protein